MYRVSGTILDTQLSPDGESYFDAVHKLQHGKLTVRWSYRTDGYWRISKLKLPWR